MEREEVGTFLLHQINETEDILSAHNMKDAELVATAMEMSYLSSIDEESDVLPNNRLYRQVVGSLLYRLLQWGDQEHAGDKFYGCEQYHTGSSSIQIS
jgi:hypothetical protein